MKKVILFLTSIFFIFSTSPASAQQKDQDVFVPIGKYIESGDYEKLSAWFAENLELDVLGAINNCTKNQAKLIMKNFFTNYTPKKFSIVHKGGKTPMKYAVGSLNAGGEKFRIILFVKSNGSVDSVQQLRIEKE